MADLATSWHALVGVILLFGLLGPILLSSTGVVQHPTRVRMSSQDQHFVKRTRHNSFGGSVVNSEQSQRPPATVGDNVIASSSPTRDSKPNVNTKPIPGGQHRADLAEAMLPGYKYTPVSPPSNRLEGHKQADYKPPVPVAPEE